MQTNPYLNLIVTCARHFEEDTKKEIVDILEEMGDKNAQIMITDLSGVLTVKTDIDPLDIIRKIKNKLDEEPWSIRYTLRAIPVFETTQTDIESITSSALKQAGKIKSNETYRITIEKRNSGISSSQIISSIADRIKNKVSLENYDWMVLIEILGGTSGVAVLKDGDILSVEKTKRSSE